MPLLLTLFASTAAMTPNDAYREARSIYDQGDWSALAKYTEEALARFPEATAEQTSKLRVLLAAAVFQTKKNDAAQLLASNLPKTLAGSEVAVIRLRVLASLAKLSGKESEAIPLLDQAMQLALLKHPKLASEVASARTNFRTYSLKQREQFGREGLRLARRYPDTRSEFLALTALGRVLGLEERFDEAITMTQKALALANARKMHFDVLEEKATGHLGWFYVALGDEVTAEQYSRAALAAATRIGLMTDLMPWRLQLGNIAVARGDLAAAEFEFKLALEAADRYSRERRGEALASLASVAIETKRYEEAHRLNAEALEEMKEDKDPTDRLHSRVVEARIKRETDHLDDARQILEQVIAETTSPFVRFEAEAERMRLGVARNDAGAAEERFRGALSAIGAARDEIKSDERKLPFLSLFASLYRDYVDFLVASGRARDALRVAELSRARTLAEGLGVERDRTGELDPEAIARKANVTVLSYWLAPRRSFLFVVTPEGVTHFILPAAGAINDKVDAYQKDLNNQRRGSELYAMLVAPAAGTIHGNRVTVIPDGHLAAFNFETLVTPKGQYWIENVILESANALQFVSAPRSAGSGKMLLIGNAPKADPQFPPLPHAAEEIAGIAKYFDQRTTLAGAAATPAAYLKSNPESYAYIHFVAHAAATRQRPLDSAVILGRDQNGYKLYARDVVARPHPLKARLVTISSCHGAGKRAFAGEGLVGLAWAFLRAGAHEVVAALWEVNDASTAKLMESMYGGIHAGLPPVDALRAAKLKLLRSNSFHSKPQYWAPFVLYSGS